MPLPGSIGSVLSCSFGSRGEVSVCLGCAMFGVMGDVTVPQTRYRAKVFRRYYEIRLKLHYTIGQTITLELQKMFCSLLIYACELPFAL
jgi:hypothetical protein